MAGNGTANAPRVEVLHTAGEALRTDGENLRLAATALGETAGFFARLDAEAAKRNVQPHEVLAAQRPEGGRAR